MNADMIAKHLISKGHECEVWFLFHTNPLDTEGVKTRVFFDRKPQGIKEWLSLCKQFLSAAKKYRADAVISFYPLTNILGSISKLFGTKRFIATQRNPVQQQSKVIYWLEMICGSTPLYNNNIAVSEYVKNTCSRYPRFYKNKLEVIHNGVPKLPPYEKSTEDCREFLQLPKDKYVVGSLGRLDKQKHVKILVEAMPYMPDKVLAIAGTGHLEEDLKKLVKDLGIEDRVFFLGMLKGHEVTAFYKAIDVFTFATHFEGFGRTLVEAFSIKRPVVASSIEVLQEVGGDAVLFASNDNAQDWANKIAMIANSSEVASNLVKLGNERVELFSLENMLSNYEKVISGQSAEATK